MSTRVELGWTAEEYERCPEMANRLHRHILDLEDENERLRNLIREAHASLASGRGVEALEYLRTAPRPTGGR